eukprot:310981-Rhodomonas_salina.1
MRLSLVKVDWRQCCQSAGSSHLETTLAFHRIDEEQEEECSLALSFVRLRSPKMQQHSQKHSDIVRFLLNPFFQRQGQKGERRCGEYRRNEERNGASPDLLHSNLNDFAAFILVVANFY